MPLHDAHYQHWDGAHLGLWARRWVIAKNGLTAALRGKIIWRVLTICWMLGLAAAALLFLVGQLLVTDSIVSRSAGPLNPQLQSLVGTLTSWLREHPEISVRTTQDVLFYYFCMYLMVLSIFALGVALPLFITRDLASNAIIIYASKAVSRGDYLLGKFCAAFGLLALTWLAPVCGAWLVGNLLSPDWRFFWHALAPLCHALIFGLGSMAVLSALALGVSALSSREKWTPALWFIWWVLGGVLQPIVEHTQPWLRHLSFTFNLRQIALAIFGLGKDLQTAKEHIPVLGEALGHIPDKTMDAIYHPALGGAVAALAVMMAAVVVILHKRVAPE
jgi:ABC-type transport system involved in multi-copper enzyme maturation permease subunit